MYSKDFYYTKDHEWAQIKDNTATVGITDFAQKQLGDVVYVELPKVGTQLEFHQSIGVVESVKAVSDIYSPLVSGKIVEQNDAVEGNPENLNEDPYGEGWIITIKPSNLDAELKNLMDFNAAKTFHEEIVKER